MDSLAIVTQAEQVSAGLQRATQRVAPTFEVGPRFFESRARWLECRDHWLEIKAASSGWENTRRAYLRDWSAFHTFLTDRPEPLDFWKVDGMVAGAWIESLQARGIGDTSINRMISALSSFYTHATTLFLVEVPGYDRRVPLWPNVFGNPFKQVQRIKVHDKTNRREWPTPDEMFRVFDGIALTSALDWRDMAILMGIYMTSRRSSEWLNLQWKNLHAEGDEFWFEYRNKGGDQKKQAMLPELYQLIVRYLQEAGRLPLQPDDFVFVALSEYARRLRKAARVVMPAGFRLVEWLLENGEAVEAYAELVRVNHDGAVSVLRAEASGTLKIFAKHQARADGAAVIGSVLGEFVVGKDYVPSAHPLSNHSANGMFKRRGAAAGVDLEKLHLHGGRHARANREWTAKDRDIVYLRDLLGHRSLSTTEMYGQSHFAVPTDNRSDAVWDEAAPKQLRALLAVGKGS